MLYNFLFPRHFKGTGVSFLLLAVRVLFGALFLTHGIDKLVNFNELSETYPSVLGLGSYMTLMLSVFCEFGCSLLLMAGLLTRVILLPMIVSMAVAFFDIHDAMMPEGELALIYMIVFFILFLTGPGRFSVDHLIDMRVNTERAAASD